MPGTAGYLTTVKRGGTPTAFSDEPMSLASGRTYQVVDPVKRVWDRDLAPTVYDDGVEVDSADIESLDYLFGRVTFASGYSVAGPVTVDGQYMPLAPVGGANSYKLNLGGDVLDDTDYDSAQASGGHRSKRYGLLDVSLTLSRWEDLSRDFSDLLLSGQAVLIEVRPGGGDLTARGWYVIESDNWSGDVAALETGEIGFLLDGDSAADFGWNE